MRARLAIVVATGLVSAACTSGDSSPTTTAPTTAPPTTAASVTTTTVPGATTTAPPGTIPAAEVVVRLDVDEEAEAAINDVYAYLASPIRQPDIPVGLLDHLTGVSITENTVFDGTFTSEFLDEDRIGVAILGEDVFLLADEGAGWKVVGAHLARFDLDPWFGEPIRHVLVIGTDARSGQSATEFRADSIHILSSNVVEQAGSILGFPRDTYVQASYGDDKFTNVNATSDRHAAEMVEIAADISGLPLDGYLITGFVDFQHLVDDFGGVLVDVPFAMNDDKAKAYLSAGLQRLWGANALAFSRVRQITGGDFTRSLHHGLVILGALEGTLERDLSMLPALVAILTEHTWTDLSPSELLTVAAGAFYIDPETVANVVLPGSIETIGGASVVVLSEDEAEAIFRDLDDGILDG